MHNKPHSEESKKKMSQSHKGIENKSRRRKTIVRDGITLYQCGICKEFKPYEDFYKNKRTILGITYECKKCHSKESVRLRNKENARAKNVSMPKEQEKLILRSLENVNVCVQEKKMKNTWRDVNSIMQLKEEIL